MSQKRIKLLASGCGRHGRRSHLLPALATGRYELVGVFDPSPASLAEVGTFAPDARAYDRFDDLLRHVGASAIAICGPDDEHLLQAQSALAEGLHVLVDKPVAVNRGDVTDFRNMMDEANRRRLVLTTCLPRRTEDGQHPYGWALAKLPELVEELGQLLHISLDFSYHRPDVDGTWREGRSLLLDHFAHDGDMAHKIASVFRGEPVLPFRARREMDTPERYLVTGMAGGVPFVCQGSRYEPGKDTFADRIYLRFQRGVCTVDTLTGDAELFWFSDGRREHIPLVAIDGPAAYDHRFTNMMDLFADAIVAGEAGHAYLSRGELDLAVEAPVLLSTGGSYSRR